MAIARKLATAAGKWAIAAFSACEAPQGVRKRAAALTSSAPHGITPPPRFRSVNLALSGKPESSASLRMTRRWCRKNFPRTAQKKEALCSCFLIRVYKTPFGKVLGGLGGTFTKSPPKIASLCNSRPLRQPSHLAVGLIIDVYAAQTQLPMA